MVFVRSKVSPLDSSTPIVNEKGCPTLQFLRLWQQMFMNEEVTQDDAATAQTTATTALTGLDAKADKVTLITAGTGLTGGGDLSTDRTISADPEYIRDTIGSALVAGTNVTITVNDGSDTITIASSGGGGGGSTPTVRSSNIQSSSNSSYTVTWPTGTIAGDVVLIHGGHGFEINIPTGWRPIHKPTNLGNWQPATFAKVMTSADITAGSVTVTTTGGFNGVFIAVTITGTTLGNLQSSGFDYKSTGTTTARAFTAPTANSSDLCIVFLSTRGAVNAACTNTGQTSLQTINATNASGCAASVVGDTDALGFMGTGTFSASGSGFYIGSVVFRGA